MERRAAKRMRAIPKHSGEKQLTWGLVSPTPSVRLSSSHTDPTVSPLAPAEAATREVLCKARPRRGQTEPFEATL